MSTIDNETITQTATLGSVESYPTFTSPLSITSTGTIKAASGDAVYGVGQAWTVTNQGVIESSGAGSSNHGVYLGMGGLVTNDAGLIEGYGGIYICGSAGTVTNTGTILDTSNSGIAAVFFIAGGSVGNTGTGLIQGSVQGVYIYGQAGTVTNSGTIIGGNNGVNLGAGGSVINTGTGLIEGNNGVQLRGVGTVANSGTIIGNDPNDRDNAVNLAAGGSVVNTGTGLIQGATGVYLSDVGTVTNSGTIIGNGLVDGSNGVYLRASGSVVNTDTGLIEGSRIGVQLGGIGTVANSGTIIGNGPSGDHDYGVFLAVGGNVVNTGAGLIEGRIGVQLGGIGTVTNSGTIIGTDSVGAGINLLAGGTVIDSGVISGASGTAIYFGGGAGNLLVLEAGYSLGGTVAASGTGNTLELAGDTGAITIDFDSIPIVGFDTVAFGAASGHDETLLVTDTAHTPGVISGFTHRHDIVDLRQINPAGLQTPTLTGNQLIVTNGSQTATLNLDSEDYTGVSWQATPDGSGGTNVGVACYCRGTAIRTPHGGVMVEELQIGDLVTTLSGEARPVRWIGRRAYDGRFIAGNTKVLPIRIAAWAIADDMPARDLFVSPEHALYIDGLLVPARQLLNGTTVVCEDQVERVEYFHIELDRHDVIFAEGAPAETYVDCDNRGMFHNAAEFGKLYPESAEPPWQFCAPRVDALGADLTVIRAALQAQAESLGYRTADRHDLHLLADGQVVVPVEVTESYYRFELPAGCREVWLASNSSVPAEAKPGSNDIRRLGVAIERFVLSDGDLTIEGRHRHELLHDGFHDDEITHRWTDGQARLPDRWFANFTGPVTLDVYLLATASNWNAEEELLLAAE